MGLHNKGQLSAYWQRIMSKADDILTERIEELESRTVSPEYCIDPSDAARMQRQQTDIDGYKSVLETVREGGLSGKLWALDTVWGENPGMVLGLK